MIRCDLVSRKKGQPTGQEISKSYAEQFWLAKRIFTDLLWDLARAEVRLFFLKVLRLKPVRKNGPWHVLCDSESFMKSRVCREAHTKCGVKLWHVPKKSPDLNPIEKYWAWLQKRLRAMDLADLQHGRSVMGKAAYRERVRRLVRSNKAKVVAGKCMAGFRKVCREVVAKKGAATQG